MNLNEVQITFVDLRIPVADFQAEMQDAADNYSDVMKFDLKEMSTRKGKHMYKFIVQNEDSNYISVIAEQDDASGDMIFHPLKLSNMNNSFYDIYSGNACGKPEDPAVFFCETMEYIVTRHKGDFACIINGTPCIISNGVKQSCEGIGLIDNNGKVYSVANAKSILGDASDTGVDFSVNIPISEWIQDHTDIKIAIMQLPLAEKMNYIGKWLIKARLNEEIDADEFMDIFRQAGIFGYTDTSVLNIYKLIM